MPAERKVDYASISAAAEHGSRLDEMLALRRRLSGVLDDEKTLARDIASISRRLLEVSREIEELETAERVKKESEGDHENVIPAESKFRPEAI